MQAEDILQMHMGPTEFDLEVELHIANQLEGRHLGGGW